MHKFIPMLQAMKIADAKAAVNKELDKLEKIPAWQMDKVKSKKDVVLEAPKRAKESPLCYIDGTCHPGWEWVPSWECEHKDCSCRYTWMTSKWLEDSRIWFPVEEIDGTCGLWRTNIISRSCIFGIHSTWMETERRHCQSIKRSVRITNFCYRNWKIPGWEKPHAKTVAWSYDMEGHAKKCVERYCELANKRRCNCTQFQRLAWMIQTSRKKELETAGELPDDCSQMVLKCLYLARIGRLDILWSVNKLARAVTKCSGACDGRKARLISFIHATNDYRQYCHVGNTAQHCILGLFQDSDFSGDFEDSKSTLGGISCIFGSRTFVPFSWMCKKQTSASHSSTESEIISPDDELRMDGVLALDLWDVVIEVLQSSNNAPPIQKISTPKSKPKRSRGKLRAGQCP